MTVALDCRPEHQVLEIGTGSGYHAAVLSHLARHVYTIDRFRTLVELAELRFRTLRIGNITAVVGDGMLGWPANATFDRIIVTAATEDVPPALVEQLKPNGVMVVPIGPADGVQTLKRLEKTGRRLRSKRSSARCAWFRSFRAKPSAFKSFSTLPEHFLRPFSCV